MKAAKIILSLKFSILYTAAIAFLCMSPPDRLPRLSVFFLKYMDKIIHFGMYYVYFIILVYETREYFKNDERKSKYPVVISFIAAACYGGMIEISQLTFTNNRSAEIYDLLANIAGILTAFYTYKWVLKNIFKYTI